jgi:anti-anti-sigma regulatory factor
MAKRNEERITQLPRVLDDDAVSSWREPLHQLARTHGTGLLELDARHLRVMSPAGLGLLAAVRLIASDRGVTVVAVSCSPAMKTRLGYVGIAAVSTPSWDSQADQPEQDWTPWWSCAAANS